MSKDNTDPKWTLAFSNSDAFQLRVNTHLTIDDLPPALEKIYAKTWALGCLKCRTINIIPICNNCGNNSYRFGLNSEEYVGIFCDECEQGFISLKCINCGSVVPVSHKTIIREKPEKSGCFIATAALGNTGSYEVQYLSKFRDNYLLQNVYGKLFVKVYYKCSPYLANFISKNNFLKYVTRFYFIRPIIHIIKLFNLKRLKEISNISNQ